MRVIDAIRELEKLNPELELKVWTGSGREYKPVSISSNETDAFAYIATMEIIRRIETPKVDLRDPYSGC